MRQQRLCIWRWLGKHLQCLGWLSQNYPFACFCSELLLRNGIDYLSGLPWSVCQSFLWLQPWSSGFSMFHQSWYMMPASQGVLLFLLPHSLFCLVVRSIACLLFFIFIFWACADSLRWVVWCSFVDFYLAILPWLFIWNLNMKFKKKVTIAASLSLGFMFVIIHPSSILYNC